MRFGIKKLGNVRTYLVYYLRSTQRVKRGLLVVVVWGAHSGQREKRDEAFFSSFRNKNTFCPHSLSSFMSKQWIFTTKLGLTREMANFLPTSTVF